MIWIFACFPCFSIISCIQIAACRRKMDCLFRGKRGWVEERVCGKLLWRSRGNHCLLRSFLGSKLLLLVKHVKNGRGRAIFRRSRSDFIFLRSELCLHTDVFLRWKYTFGFGSNGIPGIRLGCNKFMTLLLEKIHRVFNKIVIYILWFRDRCYRTYGSKTLLQRNILVDLWVVIRLRYIICLIGSLLLLLLLFQTTFITGNMLVSCQEGIQRISVFGRDRNGLPVRISGGDLLIEQLELIKESRIGLNDSSPFLNVVDCGGICHVLFEHEIGYHTWCTPRYSRSTVH